jgi:hypothetical protein
MIAEFKCPQCERLVPHNTAARFYGWIDKRPICPFCSVRMKGRQDPLAGYRRKTRKGRGHNAAGGRRSSR